MRKLNFAYALAFAPLLMGANTGSLEQALTVNKLPICTDSQYLVYQGGALACGAVQGGTAVSIPDCQTKGQLLTSTKNGDVASLSCTDKGTSSTPIDNTLVQNFQSDVT